ncbi:MAG: phage/plasmid primase, P4 family, partial [Faecalimonas sp.]|nr:phage/plasmid primase, P4 family [Faecalimonas sp.]
HEDAKSVFPVSISEFDTSVTTLNCLNGTLKFGVNKYCHRFTEHKPEDMLSKVANVNYVPDARCERWEQFVSDIMQGRQELIDFLQMSAGYALTGLTNYECFFILYGSTTRNGKGTFCETLLHLLGDYGRTAQAESIACKSFSNGSAPNEDIARLRGARFVNISEPAKDLYLNSALVKALTGNDTICARYLHQNSFEYKPQFKMFINTNHLPQVEDDSLFASGRVKLIPFERHFEANEQDTSLKAKFRQQDAMSGILNWCIEGLDKLMQAGELRSPQVMAEAVEEYRAESDTIKNFMQDILIADTYERVEGKYNCCQAVICAYCQQYGVDDEAIFRLTEGFGGGMGGLQETCGAVTGMFMGIGLHNSAGDQYHPTKTKAQTYGDVRNAAATFENICGSLKCRDLKAVVDGRQRVSCERCVETAAEILEQYTKKD